MTAEIAIMNKSAVALAADSAVTSYPAGKIYNSVNKLFTLSKYAPIGVMIYGVADLNGVPWETIIKTHRRNLGNKTFGTLKEYADDFLEYLNGANPMFPEDRQALYFRNSVFFRFQTIKQEIEAEVEENIVGKKKELSPSDVSQIVELRIRRHVEALAGFVSLQHISQEDIHQIVSRYSQALEEIKSVFQRLPLSETSHSLLKEITGLLFSRAWFEGASGIVIAGYGEKEIFPSIISFSIQGVINNKLIYRDDRSYRIDFNGAAWIVPFAQSEMADTFLRGIHRSYIELFKGYLNVFFLNYPRILLDSIPGIAPETKAVLLPQLITVGENLVKELETKTYAFQRENFIDPVVNAVELLPKDELLRFAKVM